MCQAEVPGDQEARLARGTCRGAGLSGAMWRGGASGGRRRHHAGGQVRPPDRPAGCPPRGREGPRDSEPGRATPKACGPMMRGSWAASGKGQRKGEERRKRRKENGEQRSNGRTGAERDDVEMRSTARAAGRRAGAGPHACVGRLRGRWTVRVGSRGVWAVPSWAGVHVFDGTWWVGGGAPGGGGRCWWVSSHDPPS